MSMNVFMQVCGCRYVFMCKIYLMDEKSDSFMPILKLKKKQISMLFLADLFSSKVVLLLPLCYYVIKTHQDTKATPTPGQKKDKKA